ncbi:MAG: hypothetical protein HC812_01065 [Leptolyngbya sp. RL_3_1]|nr:hypothetical protein [Leptolyngbya sp. RL_3_1]
MLKKSSAVFRLLAVLILTTAMQTPLVLSSTLLECPSCGKHSIVSPSDGVYQCLSCDFARSLNPAQPLPPKEGGLGAMLFASLGFLLTVALVL